MRDPFFVPAVPALSRAVQPWADWLALTTLPLHIHQVLGAALFYTFIHLVVSPAVSMFFFPKHYPMNSRDKRVNWDSHVVSFVQSTLINVLALWVIRTDEERKAMDWEQRVWGYTGAAGMVQAMVVGYFLWDLITTLVYINVFGLSFLAHASSALMVYSFGFRPFLNYYGCVFILYELSTPFLDMHWFFDKLHMTGSRAQLYNGLMLLVTFFSCRLVWGTVQSVRVYGDMWRAIHHAPDAGYLAAAGGNATLTNPDENIMAFATSSTPIPVWLAVLYVMSNLVLNGLNWFWFFKMIAAARKRFGSSKVVVHAGGERATTSGKTTGLDRKEARLRQRPVSILEDLIPDSEELRDGTIR